MTLSLIDQKKAVERRQAKRLKANQWRFRNPDTHKKRRAEQDGIKTVKIQNLLQVRFK